MAFLVRKTKRLILRPLTLKDYDQWVKAYSNLKPQQSIYDIKKPSPEALSFNKFKKILSQQSKQMKSEKNFYVAIFDKKSKQLIGGMNVLILSRGVAHYANIGYAIFNTFWGQGYGKEAVTALLDIGFKDLKLHRLEAGVEPKNKRSLRLAKSVGLRREGLIKRFIYDRDQWLDLVHFGITCEEVGIKWTWKDRSKAL